MRPVSIYNKQSRTTAACFAPCAHRCSSRRPLVTPFRIPPNLYKNNKGDEAGFIAAIEDVLAANGLGPDPSKAEINAVRKRRVRTADTS